MQSSTNKRSALDHAYASKRHCAVDDADLVVSKHIIIDTKRAPCDEHDDFEILNVVFSLVSLILCF